MRTNLSQKNKPYRRYVVLFKTTAGETDACHYNIEPHNS